MRKSWFTLVEVIIVLLIVSTSLFTIISWASTSTTYVSEMKQKTIALNLAKEWIEAMYNLRDTNWKKWSNQKDMCWLAANPMNPWNECWAWITQWRWYWDEVEIWWSTYYQFHDVNFNDTSVWLMLTEAELEDDREKFLNQVKDIAEDTYHRYRNFALHLSWSNRKYINSSSFTPSEKEYALWEYYRYIAVDWLYDKETWDKRKCNNWNKTKTNSDITCTPTGDCCWNNEAKELRFCSVVVYTRPFVWRVQVCSIMTNFTE